MQEVVPKAQRQRLQMNLTSCCASRVSQKNIEVNFQQDSYGLFNLNVPTVQNTDNSTIEERTVNEKAKEMSLTISDYAKINHETNGGSNLFS